MSSHTAGPTRGAASVPTKFPSRKDFQGLVTVVVGPCKKEFTVHKDLLSFYSDYFRAAFNGSFVEATDKRIELHDVDPEVFDNFHAWLYMRKLISDGEEPLSWRHLVYLWIFGDRFQVPMLQNCVMDELTAKIRRGDSLRTACLKLAYENTVDGSPLRKFMIDYLAYRVPIGNDDQSMMTSEYRTWYTVEILQDLVQEMDAARKNKVPYDKLPKRDMCFFHVHGKDEHCWASKGPCRLFLLS